MKPKTLKALRAWAIIDGRKNSPLENPDGFYVFKTREKAERLFLRGLPGWKIVPIEIKILPEMKSEARK